MFFSKGELGKNTCSKEKRVECWKKNLFIWKCFNEYKAINKSFYFGFKAVDRLSINLRIIVDIRDVNGDGYFL